MLAEPGKQNAIYLFHGTSDREWGCSFIPEPGDYTDTLTIISFPSGLYAAKWIDPFFGVVKHSESLNWKGGDLKLVTPGYTTDITLWLHRK